MCGRYQIAMEEDIIEIREILDEINERYKSYENRRDFPHGDSPRIGVRERKAPG